MPDKRLTTGLALSQLPLSAQAAEQEASAVNFASGATFTLFLILTLFITHWAARRKIGKSVV